MCPVLQICVHLENTSKQGSLQAVNYVKTACDIYYIGYPLQRL